ncbi:DUF559 domain-containing protein [Leptospira wolffii]|uniref:endonuclease domain-containing protein n=1 Tax=Leptospira wolffii TaxID=409998 RepID=UPI0010842868|nr:DUF559 domain-containing protein [Leptospira wolffii]TGK71451.1 DUF559 domain-containing protein [Leptospira wolffii]TGL29272.1 DUF559 domain-containing protein [Leptospira wolffii]
MAYYCNACKVTISSEVYIYSVDKIGRPLCRNCQTTGKKNKPESTPAAKSLYKALLSRGVPAKLELFDGFKHIDIAIPKAKVNIEVDGGHHNFDKRQALADLKRTYYSFKKGYLTLRIPNSLITKENLDETADFIVDFLNESVDQLESDKDLLGWLKRLF